MHACVLGCACMHARGKVCFCSKTRFRSLRSLKPCLRLAANATGPCPAKEEIETKTRPCPGARTCVHAGSTYACARKKCWFEQFWAIITTTLASNFPTSLDAFPNPASNTELDGTADPNLRHSVQHSNVNDAIAALEAKVGVDGSAVVTSFDYLLKNAAALNPGHTHSLSSLSDFNVSSPSNGQVLKYHSGSGKWINDTDATGGGGSPGGADTQVQFNDGGAFAGSSNMTWDKTNFIFKIDGYFDFYNGIRGVRMRQSETSGSTRTLLFQGAGDNPSMTGFRILPGLGSESTNGYKTLYEQYAHLSGANYSRLFMLSLYGDGTYGTQHVIAADNSGATAASIAFRVGTGVWDTLPEVLKLNTDWTIETKSHNILNPYGTGAGNTSELRFKELAAGGSNYVGFKAPDAISSNVIWTLPGSAGGNGDVLVNNGSTTFVWQNLANTTTRVSVAKNGSLVGDRRKINFIEGHAITFTVADDSVNEEIDVTVATRKATCIMQLCAGETPSGTGGWTIFMVPRLNAGNVTFNVKRAFIRSEVSNANTTTIQIERSTGTGVFSAGNVLTASLSLTSAYETSTTSFSITTLTSGDKVRVNFSALGASQGPFYVELELEEA